MSIGGLKGSKNFVSEKPNIQRHYFKYCGIILLILLGGSLSLAATTFALTATQRDIEICEKDRDLEKAKKHCHIVWEGYPNPPVTKEKYWLAVHNLGVIDALSGQYQSAIRYFNKAIELLPRKAESIQERGRAYAALGNYDKAFEDFKYLIHGFRQTYYRGRGLGDRGLLYKKLGQHDKAREDLTEAAILGNKDKEVLAAAKEYGLNENINKEMDKRRDPNYGRMEALKKIFPEMELPAKGVPLAPTVSAPSKPRDPDFDLGDELDF